MSAKPETFDEGESWGDNPNPVMSVMLKGGQQLGCDEIVLQI